LSGLVSNLIDMAARNHFGAERVVRPEGLRAYVAIDVVPISSVLMAMVALLMMSMLQFQQGLDVFLPVVVSGSLDACTTQVVVEITADRAITVNAAAVALPELEGRLRLVLASRRDKTVYVIGAGALRYCDVVPLIDAAYGAGAARVGIVTERMLGRRVS
jgi:biopolymer transport protein ExbD